MQSKKLKIVAATSEYFMQVPFVLNIYEGKELVISLANKLFL
jgi:hypothetical protein